MEDTDRIERSVSLRAPRTRVWRAPADSAQFGAWFGMNIDGPFTAGGVVHGRITNPRFEGMKFELRVERVEPESLFSYRWHPYAVDPAVDYSAEPTTLVEFRLADAPEGTLLTVVESGFDRIPLARRAEALRMNQGGWTAQIANIERYVTAG